MIIDLVKGRKKYLDSVIKDIKSKIPDCPDGIPSHRLNTIRIKTVTNIMFAKTDLILQVNT